MAEDIITSINKQYFSSEKDEVNIMADFRNCVQRLITVITIEDLMQIANTGYEPNHENKEVLANQDGEKVEQTTVTYVDKYNFATLQHIHECLMDALVLSLRNLFYCKKNSNTAGTFVARIAKLPNLQELNENHLPKVNFFCFHKMICFLTVEDFQKGFVMLDRHKKSLKNLPQDRFLVINSNEENIAVYDPDSQKAHILAKIFYNSNYKNKNNTNLEDIKTYELFNIKVPTDFYSKAVENIKQRIPKSLNVMMLR